MQQAQVFDARRCGVLLHLTSLPQANLGDDAYRFVDCLCRAGVSIWQMLPLGPTHNDGSPYQCLSAHAGNQQLISLELLSQQPWITPESLQGENITAVMTLAWQQFDAHATASDKAAFSAFCEQQQDWLEDYVLFREIRHLNHDTAWFDWPQPLRDRNSQALADIRTQRADALTVRRFEQFIFFSQWQALRSYANQRGIYLFGDMPIFVAHDSSDVWASPELFTLDELGIPTKVAGVPPDYFSETGQRWGNPLYEWQTHIDENFHWWQQRLETQLQLFDLIRIDHFRGFEACWEIPAECETAIDGRWVEAPGEQLFEQLLKDRDALPLVAEDLGIITEQVTDLRRRYGLPGMKILQFAFGGDASNPYLPHQHETDSICYTGTHDNNTTLGWYQEIDEATRTHLHSYFASDEEMPWMLIRAALRSVSGVAVIPMQDLLSLDGNHRMNVPGTVEGNWRWQFSWDQLEEGTLLRLLEMNELYGRKDQ